MSVKRSIPNLLKTALFGFLFAILASFAVNLPLNTYALPEDTPASSEETTEEPNPATPTTDETESPTEEKEDETPADTPTTEETTTEDTPTNGDADGEELTGNNCLNQTGAVGWIICPSTGLIANAADALYSIIGNYLVIDPISFNNESPIYIIWDYCRGITNLIFIIILLIVIYSEVTGLGFSNYNVKRTLPRIIVAAILINLSFVLSSLAVDLSNIIGASLRDFFNNIAQTTLAGAEIDTSLYSLGNITNTVITGGAIGSVAVGIVATGGGAAFFWMLLPVLLGALISVVSGLITIFLRQAVVLLLVIIAPLAVVAYALPNTEKWFTKWKNIFFQMLIFFPTFSFLFGVSQLIGFVFITSANNIYGIILGVAVQIFPLFFSWQLMKMSGTALGSISSKINALGHRPMGAFGAWAGSHQALSRAQHNATSRMPSARINRFLEDRKTRRNLDTARYNNSSSARAAANAYNPYNRRGQLTRRGERLYGMQGDTLRDQARLKQFQAELEEQGYGHDGKDRRVRASSLSRVRRANESIIREVDHNRMADSFLESAKTANATSHAERIESSRNQITAIRNQLADGKITEAEAEAAIAAVNPNLTATLSSISDAEKRTQFMNNIFANAISAQSKADRTLRDNYAQLYANTQLTRNIHAEFDKSFGDRNYNAMEAAIDELAKRGDFDLIRESLINHSGEIAGEDNVEMQKHLADTLIKYKADSAPLWAYAKSTNIRRARHAAHPDQVALFTTYEEFERGAVPAGYDGSISPDRIESKDTTKELSMSFLVNTINDPGIAMKQDRTTFKYLLEAQQSGRLDAKDMGFAIKQLRSAASSGQIDGEQLGNLNKLLTGGIILDENKQLALDPNSKDPKKQRAYQYIKKHEEQIRDTITSYLRDMSAGQLAGMKESTFNALNDALIYLCKDAHDYGTGKKGGISQTFYDAIYTNAASNMNNILKSNMNTNIKTWLGIQSNRQ